MEVKEAKKMLEEETKKVFSEVVMFKTDNAYFWKERAGLKPNTVRREEKEDARFKSLRRGVAKRILIVHSDSGLTFERYIKDVTFFEGIVIISWVHLEASE